MKREKRESLPRAAKKKAGATRSSSAESSSPVKAAEQVRKCAHCASEKTPKWRAGPSGPKTLCNACGVRHKSGRLVPEYRPAASPTFVLTQHSNLHWKVMEMRIDSAPESAPESEETAQAEKEAAAVS